MNCIEDSVGTKYLSVSINNNLPSATLAVYHKRKYTANGYANTSKKITPLERYQKLVKRHK